MNKNRRRFLKTGLLGGAAIATGCNAEVSVEDEEAGEPFEPLRILILGGTGYLGPHMVREALRRGHDVSLFNRGRTNRDLFPDLKLYVGDRNNGLDSLQGGKWDAVIDNSGYVPRQVGDSARLLAPAVSQYVFVSTISVYGDLSGPIDEGTAVATMTDESVEEVTNQTYGAMKALCEQRVIDEMGADRSVMLRPTYICGPGDRTDRYAYWPVRTMRGGEMLWPGAPEDDIQIIDVRDLAGFSIDCVEQGIAGTFNTATPAGSFRMGDLLEDSLAVTGASTTPVWVNRDFIARHSIAAQGRIPIWADPEGEARHLMRVDASRAAAAGLVSRPTRETARDTIAWWKALPEERRNNLRAGLSAAKEAEYLALWQEENA